jgi:3-hydroxyacyl-CoA dehydrogenase
MAIRPFKKVCVIGAGVMGSGIAAHLANARVPVLLLDIVPPKYSDADEKAGLDKGSRAFRDKFSRGGLAKALKAKPAAFMSKSNADLIETGNIDDDLARINECDWIIEVVLENMDVKRDLFAKIEKELTNPETIITSNTSGLKIEEMIKGRPEHFAKRFFVTHFFNPVRYLHLLELVSGEDTDPTHVQRIADFGEHILGKGIVYGKDTPNFVANRIGVFGMMETMRVMVEDGYTVEEVDAVFGNQVGRAKSAVFRTADVVGLDTFIHVAQNCWDNLKEDERHDVFKTPDFLKKMVENGWTGSKGGQGFYKKEGKEISALNLKTMEYAPKEKVRIDSLGAIRGMDSLEDRLEHMAYADDRAGQLFWKVTAATGIYAANRLGEIADDIVQIDNGMKWGFANDMGPFEVWDAIGVKKSVEKMVADGMSVPSWVTEMVESGRESFYAWGDDGKKTYWDPNAKKAVTLDEGERVKTFLQLKRDEKRVVKDLFGASLVDLGDGVLACEFHTKMNAIDADIVTLLNEGLDLCEAGKYDALVLANDDKAAFSAGANIMMIVMAAQAGEWDQIETMVKELQDTVMRLRYSPVPTVAAPFQLALGGGCELTLYLLQQGARSRRDLHGPRRGGRRCAARGWRHHRDDLPRPRERCRRRELPGGADAAPWPREHRHGQGGHERRGGEGASVHAEVRRRDHEPSPPPRGGEAGRPRHGARGLHAAASPQGASARQGRARHLRDGAAAHARRPLHQRPRPEDRAEDRGDYDRRRHLAARLHRRAVPARHGARRLPLAVRRGEDPGAHHAHAPEGQTSP